MLVRKGGSEIRTAFINCAKTFLGFNEADGTYKEIIDVYNSISPLPRGYRLSYSDPWCAAFVSAVGERAGLKSVLPECSCDAMIEQYKARGLWQAASFMPQPGDLIFYDWDRSGTADHVGIIADVTDKVLKVIEGNVSNSVEYRILTHGTAYIKGYAIAFPLEGEGAERSEADEGEHGENPPPHQAASLPASPQGEAYKVNISIPTLSRGCAGNSVRALQHLLIGNGHSCGAYGADGQFGAKTRDALIGFQKRAGLDPDAIAGKQTWTKLLL